MLRSSRIPPLLSRITGDGIHTALLITSDGELLGSTSVNNMNGAGTTKSKPVSSTLNSSSKPGKIPAASSSSTASTSSLSTSHPSSAALDKESIAALIAEVTSDYHRAGQELLLMNFNHPNASGSNHHLRRTRGGRFHGNSGRDGSATLSSSAGGVSSSAAAAGTDGQSQNQSPPQRDHGSILSCLLLEMEMGLIGVASAGSDCLVIAIADQGPSSLKVEHGLMKARLTAVAGYIRDTFSQLNAPPL